MGRGLTGLRLRLIGLFVLLALAVASVMILAVHRFSSEQIMRIAMASGFSEAEAQAMFNRYIGGVLLVGAAIGVALGGLAAWWLLRRVLRPLDRLAAATRAIAGGDLATRVPPAPDEELKVLGDAFNAMASSLERGEALRRRLVEDVAHELRTPLTSVQGYLEAMADGIVEPTPAMVRAVHEEIVRITRLVEDLDRLGRGPDTTMSRIARQPTDLEAIVRQVAAIHEPRLATRGMSLKIVTSANLPMVSADPDAIRQVLTNLLENAGRYADDGGRIAIVLADESEVGVTCAVENDGPTIPASELPLVWERLYRVDQSRSRRSGGSGIGLAIVRQIVEQHGGSVGASSADGHTRVWFSLPVIEPGGTNP